MKVYGYGRVSTEVQEKNGLSLKVQKAVAEKWFEHFSQNNACEWAGWYEDPARSAVTTSFFDRPAARKIFSLVSPGDIIVGLDQTRMFRTMTDTEESIELLNRLGVRIAFARSGELVDTTSPEGRLFYRVKAITSSYEIDTLKIRCKESYHNREKMGLIVNKTIPVGWEKRYKTVDGKRYSSYHPCQHDRDLAKKLWEMNKLQKISIVNIMTIARTTGMRRSSGAKMNNFDLIRRFILAHELGYPDTYLFEPNPDWKPGEKKTRLKKFPKPSGDVCHASL